MKPKFDKISFFSVLFILFLITIPGLVAYYSPSQKPDRFSDDSVQRMAMPEFQEDSKIFDSRIVLRKDKSITVNNSRLVFKGLKDKKIHLDVYLLELDPESAYPHYISKADAFKGIRVGDATFRLLKVSNRTLQLEIVDLFQS